MKKIAVLVGLILALTVTSVAIYAKREHLQKDLTEKVFRFHVLANSDRPEDQALKMQVKEEILSYMKEQLP